MNIILCRKPSSMHFRDARVTLTAESVLINPQVEGQLKMVPEKNCQDKHYTVFFYLLVLRFFSFICRLFDIEAEKGPFNFNVELLDIQQCGVQQPGINIKNN